MADERLCADFEALRNQRIFFGHQSVGRDILLGADELHRIAGCTGLRIVGASAVPAGGGYLAESPIGRNGYPESKCEEFSRQLDQLGDSLDFALMKFCYVDFGPATRVVDVLAEYEKTVRGVRTRHPRVCVIYVTAPLVSPPGGLKVALRHLLGRIDDDEAANLKREQFNATLRKSHSGEPFFDLAAAESTYPDGRRCEYKVGGHTAYSLVADYTSDGGHLNALGRRMVARELLRALAEAARRRNEHSSALGGLAH